MQPARRRLLETSNVREMTDYERIRNLFNATSSCRNGKQPQLHHEPGCDFIECSPCDKCRCRLADGDGGPVSAFLIRWRERFAK
jgi:hypothetical protein